MSDNNPYDQPAPQPPKKSHKVRNWILGIVGAFLALAIIGSFIPDEETAPASGANTTSSADEGGGIAETLEGVADDTQDAIDEGLEDRREARQERKAERKQERRDARKEAREERKQEREEAAQEAEEAAQPSAEQENALGSATDYLDMSGFSASGLIQQLEFEGYPTADAQWAIDNCGADWNAEAAEAATDYLDMSSFSRQGLIDQLTFEGFTPEQAAYGVTQAGL